jgi:hypothetical protein
LCLSGQWLRDLQVLKDASNADYFRVNSVPNIGKN